MNATATQIVKGSEIRELCLRIADVRDPALIRDHEKALKAYERKLAKGAKEILIEQRGGVFHQPPAKPGFYELRKDGQAVVIYRPQKPSPPAWSYSAYSRDFGVSKARQYGLLASPRYNRDIRPDRVEQYGKEMEEGRWRDLLSDPISITTDGQVLNGQHRLAAAAGVDWAEVEHDPAFLVIWGVEPLEAQFADGSRRTAHDERTIARNLLAGAKEGVR